MSDVGVSLPKNDDLSQVPSQVKFIKDILENHARVMDVMKTYEQQHEAPLEPRLILKKNDPGKFTIPCSLGDLELDDALCDSGSCVNLISHEMVKSLGIKELKRNTSSISFADASSKCPIGMLEDYPLKVGNYVVPTDFMVVEMETTRKLPLILGTPYLGTTGASIDFVNERAILFNVDSKVYYPITSPTTNFCGTIACNEDDSMRIQVKKEPTQVVNESLSLDGKRFYEEVFDGSCLNLLFEEPLKMSLEVKTPKVIREKPKESKTSTLFLYPMKFVDDTIEYKVKCKGMAKPFCKVKAFITPELKEKGQTGLEELMHKVITFELHDNGTCFDPHIQSHSTSMDPPTSSKTPPPLPIPKVRD